MDKLKPSASLEGPACQEPTDYSSGFSGGRHCRRGWSGKQGTSSETPAPSPLGSRLAYPSPGGDCKVRPRGLQIQRHQGTTEGKGDPALKTGDWVKVHTWKMNP